MTHTGSHREFDANWRTRGETLNNYWTAGSPGNQIQLAFGSHWNLFGEYLEGHDYRTCLEVGCGRGSISSFFAAGGFDCTLLDFSESVLNTAKSIFAANRHDGAGFTAGDANLLPFADGTFDVVVSIGLLEHFESVSKPLQEQMRVLRPDGLLLAYVVPHRPDNVQRYFNWINRVLKMIARPFEKRGEKRGILVAKTPVFRSDANADRYIPVLEKLRVNDVKATDLYPLPMISHSPEFPFSLLPAPAERVLTAVFKAVLRLRRTVTGRNPWICRDHFGQAFLLTCRKN